ncbi:MAG: GlsB/YeaQ/YmgE family stress response membrane protein [Actinomycetota bacterium]|nr:GlsB/YeaQ/YmgE family stress response membrane protein [Actinomycetota bacterium]
MLLALLVILVLLFIVLPIIGLALWALISTVVVGLVIGAVARLVIPGQQPIGMVATVICGLSGSIIGGFVGQHVLKVGGFPTVLLEIVVAALAVVVVSRTGGRRLSTH